LKIARALPPRSVAVFAVCWIALVFVAFGVFQNRIAYSAARADHVGLQHRIDDGEASPVGLSELFEYRATAAESYMLMLESALIFGAAPAILVMFVALLATASNKEKLSSQNSDKIGSHP
jgi:hypothetical protein